MWPNVNNIYAFMKDYVFLTKLTYYVAIPMMSRAIITLMMEEVHTSETSANFYGPAGCSIPET